MDVFHGSGNIHILDLFCNLALNTERIFRALILRGDKFGNE